MAAIGVGGGLAVVGAGMWPLASTIMSVPPSQLVVTVGLPGELSGFETSHHHPVWEKRGGILRDLAPVALLVMTVTGARMEVMEVTPLVVVIAMGCRLRFPNLHRPLLHSYSWACRKKIQLWGGSL